jgi:uncharacterized cupredoxin-like copper-binding protein
MRRTILMVLATGLLMAGCGDDDEETTPTSEAPAAQETQEAPDTQSEPSGGGGTRVVLTEFAIDPANPTAKAGKATFEVVNEGQAPHALEIEGNGIEVETDVLDGGGSATLEADLTAGEYKWYCPVGNHADQGMAGTLTVE